MGEVIAVIAGPDEDISSLLASAEGATASPRGDPSPGAAAPRGPDEASEAQDQQDEGVVDSGGGEAAPGSIELGGRVRASPLARRLASEADLDLQRVQGSGPGGRIVKRDVEAAKAGVGVESMAPAPGQRAGVSAGTVRVPGVDFEDMPLSQMRKTIAKRLVESLGPVPHFFLRITVDMSRTMEARKRVNRLLEAQGEKVSINDFILKATANALERHPEVNAQWTGDAIRRHYRVHLGVAVAVDDGSHHTGDSGCESKGVGSDSREVRELAGTGQGEEASTGGVHRLHLLRLEPGNVRHP